MRSLRILLTLLPLFIGTNSSFAHDTQIALLTITETQSGQFNMKWRLSTAPGQAPTPVFPKHCEFSYPLLQCGPKGLMGRFQLLELGPPYSAAVIQIIKHNQPAQAYTLTPTNHTVFLTASGQLPLRQIMATYFVLGFEHILLGIDHLLFVLGLMWLVKKPWMLVKTITAFTIAHSMTLAAVTLGYMGVKEEPVNAAIALSIAILAVEVLKYRRGEPCLSAKMPWVIAFGFGLLHGLGFADALTEIGLPEKNLPAALLFFNVGVELGQIGFVLIVLAILWSHRILQAAFPRWCETAAIYGIGTIGCFWFLTRFQTMIFT